MGYLEGKTALITGGTAGIGLGAARRLVKEGAHVFITGRDQRRLDDAVEEIGTDSATAVRSDVSNNADLDAVAQAISNYGKGLDVIFTNAGGGEFASLADSTPEHLEQTFQRNVFGTVFTVQKLLPLLNERASIILSGSTAATEGTPTFGAYAASKAAVRSFGRTWAAELVDRGIRVNTVIPGPIETPGLAGLAPSGQEQALLDSLAEGVPLRRLGQVDEIASAIVFLASDQSSYMTGAELAIDGGKLQV
jgi:NAD(P)-dependent dehydrogenase (short-subunit alcohol dehydrogenase family)